MELLWHGQHACTVQSDGVICALNPLKGTNIPKANFVVVTEDDSTMYDAKILETSSYTVNWPGEYEVQGHLIVGVELPDTMDGAIHTMMGITTIDHVSVAHVGVLSSVPEAKTLGKLGTVHVLLLPLTNALKLESFLGIIDTISPSIVVPMADESASELLAQFLKHFGKTDVEPQKSLKLSRPDTTPEFPEIVLLSSKV